VRFSRLSVIEIVASLAPLERYAKERLEFIKRIPHARLYGSKENPFQVIYGLVLAKEKGVSPKVVFREIEMQILANPVSPGIVFFGSSQW
jgi:hypothetical protein